MHTEVFVFASSARNRERLLIPAEPVVRLDLDGICTRIDVYKTYGYFEPEPAEALKKAARQRNIEHPPTILRRFVERYARR